MTYISKYQNRKQTIATSKITSLNSIERYDIFYDMTFEAISRNAFPVISFSAGQLLMRKTGEHHTLKRHYNIEESRQIPPEQFSALSKSVRYSGVRLDGKPGQGVLYVGTLAGVLREITHYDLKGSAPALSIPGRPDGTRAHIDHLKNKASGVTDAENFPFHVYKLRHNLRFADIRSTSLSMFLSRAKPNIDGESDIQNQLRLMSVYEGDDYSAARGIADAVYDAGYNKGIVGVCADSSRTDSDAHLYHSDHGDKTGGAIIALFGKPGETVNALEPVQSFPDFQSMREFVL